MIWWGDIVTGMFCNKCGKRITGSEIFFHGEIFPAMGESAISGDGMLFDIASVDVCKKCFQEEVERMRKEFRFPSVERSGDGTRYRAL